MRLKGYIPRGNHRSGCTAAAIEKIKHLRFERKLPWKAIAKHLSISHDTVRKWAANAGIDTKERATEFRPYEIKRRQIDIDAERQLQRRPADTRTLTARLLGDPPPGRSALDMRQGR